MAPNSAPRVRRVAEPDPTLVPLHEEIVRAFHYFNARFWSGSLPPPVFGWYRQPSNGHRLGHFGPGSWKDGEERKHEIILYADLCFHAGVEQVLLTLLHEMVHLWQQEHGKPGKNNHHNRQWHAEAKRVGLVTEGKNGTTKAGEGFCEALAAFAPRLDVIPYRLMRIRQKGKMRLWQCQCNPPVKIRAGRADIDFTCNRCGELVTLQD